MRTPTVLTMHEMNRPPRPLEPDALYEAVYAGTSEAILVFDEDRQIVEANPAALALLGYSREEIIGAPAGAVVPLAQTWTSEEAARFAQVGHWEGEGQLRRKDGSFVDAEGSARLIRLPCGRGLAINVFREASSRRAAAQAIAAREAHFRALIESSADIVTQIYLDGRMAYVSPSITAMMGYAPEEMVGQVCFEYVHQEDQDDLRRGLERVRQAPGAIVALRCRARHRDGSWRWLEGTIRNLLADPSVQSIVLNARDVTERVTAEEALRASEARLRHQYFENPIPTFTWQHRDGEFVLVDFNRAATILTVGGVESTVGYPASRLLAGYPTVLSDLRRCLLERHVFQHEIRMRYSAGPEEHDFIVTYVPVEPDLIMVHTEDVTERRRAERQQEALRRAERFRTLGQLAGGVAHDFNQSLSLIAGYTELALSVLRDPAPDTAAARDSLELVASAASDGAAAVRRLLTFSRGEPESDPELVVVADLLRETARLTSPRWRDGTQAEGRPVSLEVEAEDGLLLKGWPSGLREALTNLIFNAVDALPDGGTIRLAGRRAQGQIEIAVSDDGIGMAPEVLERVFEPFFTTKGERGTGLGLAMVFHVAERHAGAVRVHSELGRGTTFVLSFEAHRASATPAVAPESGPMVGALRVLAVDDEPNLVRMVGIMLGQRGHQVSTATSAEEALEILHEQGESFDVLITDLGLGEGQNGWALIDQASVRWPRLRCILATGWGADIDPEEARQRHVAAVVPKPYRIDDLQRAIFG